ncbi:MAG: DUF222 domain-containing protein [Gammaproteobacteria bacterium]|nr:DUF222 domain-containing protein [Gammaproteobacteria bacterium]
MNAIVKHQLTIDQLADAILEHCRQEDSAVCNGLSFLADFDLRQGYRHWGSADCADWLAFKCDMARSTAKERVRVAAALRHLPQIEQAFRRGDLSYSKVRALTRVADDHNEAALLDKALDYSAAQLERFVSRIRHADDAASTAEALRAIERRYLSVFVREDGLGSLTAELPEADLELVRQALEFVCSGLPALDGQSIHTRQAHALVQMARDTLAGRSGERGEGKAGDHYQVVVHVDATALQGEGGESDLPVATVRRMCCDGSVVALLKNHSGEPLSIGRKQRTIPTAIGRIIEARDRTCRFPGCGHDKWLEGHHIRHWALGGETSVSNLIQLCDLHHTLVHEGGWSISRVPSGEEVYFVRPDGTPLEINEKVVTVRTGRVSEMGDSLLSEETASEEKVSEETAGGDRELQVREARPMYVVASS